MLDKRSKVAKQLYWPIFHWLTNITLEICLFDSKFGHKTQYYACIIHIFIVPIF